MAFDTGKLGVLTGAMRRAGFRETETRAVTDENVNRFLLSHLPPGRLKALSACPWAGPQAPSLRHIGAQLLKITVLQ